MSNKIKMLLVVSSLIFFTNAQYNEANAAKKYKRTNKYTTDHIYSTDGTYLGNTSTNKYDANSVNNPYGDYGSKYSTTSTKNPYGDYGSRYSNTSPTNPYATEKPKVYDSDKNYLGDYDLTK